MDYTYQQLNDPFTGQLTDQYILRLPDRATIPNDDQNTDWQQYQLWLSQGNTPLPPA